MKKIIISLFLCIIFLGLTGCSKQLVCEITPDEESIGVSATARVITSFTDDLSTKATVSLIFEDEEAASKYYEELSDLSEGYILNGKVVSIMKTIVEEDQLNYEDAKALFEEQGYTCK